MTVLNSIAQHQKRRLALFFRPVQNGLQRYIIVGRRHCHNALMIGVVTHGVQLSPVHILDHHALLFALSDQWHNGAGALAVCHQHMFNLAATGQQLCHCVAPDHQAVCCLFCLHCHFVSPFSLFFYKHCTIFAPGAQQAKSGRALCKSTRPDCIFFITAPARPWRSNTLSAPGSAVR